MGQARRVAPHAVAAVDTGWAVHGVWDGAFFTGYELVDAGPGPDIRAAADQSGSALVY